MLQQPYLHGAVAVACGCGIALCLYLLSVSPVPSSNRPPGRTVERQRPLAIDWNAPSPRAGQRVGRFVVSSDWGPRPVPCPNCSKFHAGVDVAAAIGSPVYAVGEPGEMTTVECRPDDGMGKPWSIQRAPSLGSWRVEALHLSECYPGKHPAGAVIAKSGTAGTGPHYHIQVRNMDALDNGWNGKSPPPKRVVQLAIGG